jgi:hypothetical protein
MTLDGAVPHSKLSSYNGDVVAGIEIRDYCGDFEDVTELTRRVWTSEYSGKVWVPIADVEFLRWRLGPGSDAVCPVAYHGTKIVGTIFSVPHPMRIARSAIPVSLSTMFTVDPDHRRAALPLIERLRRLNEDRGIALMTGLVLGDPASISYRFWTKYAETYPNHFRFIFRGSYWAKFLSPRELAKAGLNRWERLASRALGPMLRWTPHQYDPHVRAYRASDLEHCVRILDKTTKDFDWALVWPPETLSYLLANPTSGTLIFERNGFVQGFAHYHLFLAQGRLPVRAALIDLWADDGLTALERVRFVAHLCNHLREQDVHLVAAARSAMLPAAAFVANLFVPMPEHFHIVAFFTRGMAAPSPPKSWSLVLT